LDASHRCQSCGLLIRNHPTLFATCGDKVFKRKLKCAAPRRFNRR
jgi:hypothetical protein